MDMQPEKKALRLRMARLRDALPPEDRAERSRRICRQALAVLRQWRESGAEDGREDRAVLVYVPFRSEADTWPLIRELWREGVPVAAPKTDPRSGELALYRIEGERQLKPGAWGISEPDPDRCEPVDPAGIGAVIVPGLAFDRRGGRLGYGAGYYDRLFRAFRAGGRMPLAIGFAFAAQLVDRVPMEPHDVPVDRVVTEEGALGTGAGRLA